jgi:hypothetical protein
MSTASSKISTTVRLYAQRQWLRASFRLSSLLRPQATLRRAGDIFCTPFPSSRERALSAPTGQATEADLDLAGQHIHTYVWGDPQMQPYVLFAHGWSSHGTRFLPWVEHLRAGGYAVVAFDEGVRLAGKDVDGGGRNGVSRHQEAGLCGWAPRHRHDGAGSIDVRPHCRQSAG